MRRYSLARYVRKWLIKAKAKDTNTSSSQKIRYDYKRFSLELGRRLREVRKASGKTLRDLIVQHGFHLTQIQRVEKGEGVSVQTLLRISEAFQVPVEELIAGLGLLGPESESSEK